MKTMRCYECDRRRPMKRLGMFILEPDEPDRWACTSIESCDRAKAMKDVRFYRRFLGMVDASTTPHIRAIISNAVRP